MLPDFVNGLFEFCGAGFIGLHIQQILRDKAVRGVSILATTFFATWGLWNLFYYPHLGQWWSFTGGLAIVTANTIWIGLMLRYRNA